METFEVELSDKRFIIEPQNNGTFRILENEVKIGVIYPESEDLKIGWKTMDNLEQEFVDQLGESISSYQLNSQV